MARITSLSFVATIGRPQCSIVQAVELHGRAVTVLPLQGKAGEARALLSRTSGQTIHLRWPEKSTRAAATHRGGRNLEM
jgi:hypothetical protein